MAKHSIIVKVIAAIISTPVVIPLRMQSLLSRCRRLGQLKEIKKLKKELRLKKEQNRIISSAIGRADQECKRNKQKLRINAILKK